MHVLPDNLRDVLKEPVGMLVDEQGLIKVLKDTECFVSVGDTVTFTVLKHGFSPLFCVVDFRTRRGPVSADVIDLIKKYGRKSVVVDNPQGVISDDLWNAIKYAFESKLEGGLRIEVNGEEDLASLVALYFAPLDVTIIYGLPDKGVLVVRSTSEIKDKISNVFKKM